MPSRRSSQNSPPRSPPTSPTSTRRPLRSGLLTAHTTALATRVADSEQYRAPGDIGCGAEPPSRVLRDAQLVKRVLARQKRPRTASPNIARRVSPTTGSGARLSESLAVAVAEWAGTGGASRDRHLNVLSQSVDVIVLGRGTPDLVRHGSGFGRASGLNGSGETGDNGSLQSVTGRAGSG